MHPITIAQLREVWRAEVGPALADRIRRLTELGILNTDNTAAYRDGYADGWTEALAQLVRIAGRPAD